MRIINDYFKGYNVSEIYIDEDCVTIFSTESIKFEYKIKDGKLIQTEPAKE